MLHENGLLDAKAELNVGVVIHSFENFCPTVANIIRDATRSIARRAVLCRIAIRDNGTI